MDRTSTARAAPPAADPLCGARVLVVEDDAIIALDLLDILEEAGAIAVGPYPAEGKARAALPGIAIDAALLDVHVADGDVYPLADLLRDQGVPTVFHSGGADRGALARRYPAAPLCAKPAMPEAVLDALRDVLT